MDFNYYISFFHDGSINNIVQKNDTIEIHMNTIELQVHENKFNISLDEKNRMKGILLLKNVSKVLSNDQVMNTPLYFRYDSGQILDFEIQDHRVELGVDWINFPPKVRSRDYSFIEISAEKIFWIDHLNNITIDLTNL